MTTTLSAKLVSRLIIQERLLLLSTSTSSNTTTLQRKSTKQMNKMDVPVNTNQTTVNRSLFLFFSLSSQHNHLLRTLPAILHQPGL